MPGLNSFKCFDFSGGLDIKTSPIKISTHARRGNRMTVARNVAFQEDGSVTKRKGLTLVNAATAYQVGSNPIQGGAHYRHSTNTSQVIIAAPSVATGGNLYKLDLTGTTAVTSIKTGLTSTKPYFFATYNDTLFICNGVDAPMQYDGTTVTALGGSSPATMRVVVTHANRLFATATAVPSRLYWSKLNNPLDWSGTDDAGFMDINPNDGSVITSLVSANQELVIFKAGRPYRLQGYGPATGYTVVDNLVPSTGNIGTPWPGAAVWVGNDTNYVSRQGLHSIQTTDRFGGLIGTYISDNIEPYFRSVTTTYDTNLNLNATDDAYDMGTQVFYNNADDCVYIPVAVNATYTLGWDTLLVYDRQIKAWAVWGLGTTANRIEIVAMWPYKANSERGSLMVACYDTTLNKMYVGQLGTQGETATRDATTVSTLTYESVAEHVSNLGEPGVLKSPRYLYLYFSELANATNLITVDIFYDFSATATVTKTLTLTSAVDTTEDTIIKRVDLFGVCESMAVRVTSAGTGGALPAWSWRGYEVEWRERRRVRRAE